jgi:uncharacterized protein (TIGR03437 family)
MLHLRNRYCRGGRKTVVFQAEGRMRTRLLLGVLLLAVAGLAQTPVVPENSVLNSATYATAGQSGHAVAPGSLVSIFGTELASDLAAADSVPLSTSLGGVSVRFDDVPAPLHFVSPGQINAQLPWALLQGAQSGTRTVVVTRGGSSSQPRTVQVAQVSPGIYTISATGVGPGVVVNLDGSLAQPAGSVPPPYTAAPARISGAIIIYATGLGPVDPPVANGAASPDALRQTVTMPVVLVGGIQAQVLFSGLAPEFPGVYQLNVVLPPGVPTGDAVPIQLQIGGITSTDRVTIAVSN